jgi:hypothetical protein
MLLNPNAQGRDDALQDIAKDPFDRPVPGQSLTGEVGKHPWENPPQMTNLDQALMFILEKLRSDKKTQKGYDQLITLGMPIESMVNTIAFGGFVEGLWTVDTAELLKPPLMGALFMYAQEKGLPLVMYNNDKDVDETPIDRMSNYEVMSTMEENNPEAFSQIATAIDRVAEGKIVDNVKEEIRNNSFLGSFPESPEENISIVEMEEIPEEIPEQPVEQEV